MTEATFGPHDLSPEARALSQELVGALARSLETLPPGMAVVVAAAAAGHLMGLVQAESPATAGVLREAAHRNLDHAAERTRALAATKGRGRRS